MPDHSLRSHHPSLADPGSLSSRTRLEERVRWHAARPERIDGRLRELDREWLAARRLRRGAATLAAASALASVLVDRRYALLSAALSVLLAEPAMRREAQASALLRRFGAVSIEEIEIERYALKALRGDFRVGVESGLWTRGVAGERAAAALAAVRA